MPSYRTNQRDLILNYLHQNRHRHVTVEDVVAHFISQPEGNPSSSTKSVGKATVYRFFDVLMREGKLHKFENGIGKSACYQLIDEDIGCNSHYHFICDCCNRLFHIECNLLDTISSHVKQNHSFYINSLLTNFHGICQSCHSNLTKAPQ